MWKSIIIALILFVLTACADASEDSFYIFNYTADFSTSMDGWAGDFADYPVSEGDSIKFGLAVGQTILMMPATRVSALMISGNNYNDDLFMFIKRKVTGLRPDTEYTIVFDVQLASNAPTGNYTPAGSPGESVYLKAGAVGKNPEKIVEGDYYRMNIDKGDQGENGSDMTVIGNIGVTDSTSSYTLVTRSNSTTDTRIAARTNSAGELWLIVGTDSDYEGLTTIYYTRIDVVFSTN